MVAVSKTVDTNYIAQAIAAGIHDFGENRTQLFVPRQQEFCNERWHFIGRIQTNKLKDIVGRAHLIHSIASLRALEATNKYAQKQESTQAVLLEVNVSEEESKDGFCAADLPAVLEQARALPAVEIKGLMTMAPVKQNANDTKPRKTFAALRTLRDSLVPICAQAPNISLNELSMGMSNDFEDAVKEGATIVRIGQRLWS